MAEPPTMDKAIELLKRSMQVVMEADPVNGTSIILATAVDYTDPAATDRVPILPAQPSTTNRGLASTPGPKPSALKSRLAPKSYAMVDVSSDDSMNDSDDTGEVTEPPVGIRKIDDDILQSFRRRPAAQPGQQAVQPTVQPTVQPKIQPASRALPLGKARFTTPAQGLGQSPPTAFDEIFMIAAGPTQATQTVAYSRTPPAPAPRRRTRGTVARAADVADASAPAPSTS